MLRIKRYVEARVGVEHPNKCNCPSCLKVAQVGGGFCPLCGIDFDSHKDVGTENMVCPTTNLLR